MDQDLPFRLVLESEAWDAECERFQFCQLLFEKDGECRKAERQKATADQLVHLFTKASLVPHAYYMAPVPTTFACTRASELNSDIYIKVAKPLAYNDETDRAATDNADYQLQELTVCEVLLQNPHPNLCRYYGYLSTASGDRIRGLCFERHETTLDDAVAAGAQFPPAFLDGVHDALKHLHSLGYAHNDLNPSNIMITKAGDPVIIDFDSSLPLGRKLKKGGTIDWEYEGDISAVDNDLWALAQLREWIAGRRQELSPAYRKIAYDVAIF